MSLLSLPWPRRLAARLPSLAAVAVAAAVLACTVVAVRYDAARSRGRALDQAQALAALTATDADTAIARDGRAALERLVHAATRFPHVRAAQILDSAGGQLAGAVEPTRSAAITPPPQAGPFVEALGEAQYAVWAPVQAASRLLGWVRIEVGVVTSALQAWLAGGLAALAAAFAVAALLARALRRPLAALEEAARFAAEFDSARGERLRPAAGGAEVEALIEALNAASARLAHEQTLARASSERLAAVLNHAVDGIITLRADGRIESFNTAAEHIFGYPAAAVIGEDIATLLPEAGPGLAHWGAERTIFRNRPLEGRRRDGVTVPLEVSVGEARLEDTRLAIAIVRDVSERQLAERALAESEARKTAILQAAMDCVISLDRRGRILEFNPAAEKTFGLRRHQVIGRDVFELLVPLRSRAPCRAELTRFLATGETGIIGKRFEVEALRADGTEIPVEVAITPIALESGPIFTAYLRDIRERKAAEDALVASEARYRRVVDSVHEVIFQTDAEDRCSFLNRAWSELTGFEPEAGLGLPLIELLHPDDRPLHRMQREALLDGEKRQVRYAARLRGRDGEYRWVEVFAEADAGGLTGTLSDISEHKAIEAQLRLAKEAAEAANRAKSEFLANMSHELRTPLNAIIGMTELAFDAAHDAEQHEYLRVARAAADTLLGTIDEVLDFSRIEAGQLAPGDSGFGLRATLREALAAPARDAAGRGLELAYEVEPGVPDAVSGDPAWLRQVLAILVGNAVKFTPRGDVVVRVRTQERTADAVLLHLSVRDTGIGIAPDKLALIFQPFAQADASSTRRFGGTGLGLAIATRLVELMGGRLWVDSEPGRGSDFQFTLRLRLQSAQAAEPAPDWHGLRALVVDDSAASRGIVERQLRQWGMQTLVAAEGMEAMRLLRDRQRIGHPFDLLVLDAELPELDGFALLAALGDTPGLRPPAVLMASEPLPEAAARGRTLGVRACVAKPVGAEELRRAVEAALAAPAPRRLPQALEG